MSNQADFFVVGGTMRLTDPSYVSRSADQELLSRTQAGEFCYVLTPRQMGKSSLMIRTTQALRQAGHRAVMIDLTGIGAEADTPDIWYKGLLTKLKVDLRLDIDVETWWTDRQAVGPLARFTEFLRDVVLVQVAEPIVIFIDEIDSTLKLNFSDDFFAAIRAVYNARPVDPIYKRLTFVLLGVATPSDLIKDPDRTPFNIGRRIPLYEFSQTDAQVLAQGLEESYPGYGQLILDRILYWTNGHPYLTQKLGQAAVNAQISVWDESQVDKLVEANFFTNEARNDHNLKFVQNSVQTMPAPERRQALKLYQQVYTGKVIPSDEQATIQNYLNLYGLVRVQHDRLQTRNEIYRRVFNLAWIKENTPANTSTQVAIAASLVAVLLVTLLVWLILFRQSPPATRAQVCEQQFKTTTAAAVRIDALACLFDLGAGYDEQSRRLFYNLSSTDQKYLFLLDDPQAVSQQLLSAVTGLYVSLDTGGDDRAIMEAMLGALKQVNSPEANQLVQEIEAWKQGRALAKQQQYSEAVIFYTTAIRVNQKDNHPVVHYDRAMAYVELQQYELALKDFETVVKIAQTAPPTPTPTPTQPTPTPTFTATPLPTNTPESTPTPTATSSQTPGVEIDTPAINTKPSPSTPVSPPIVTPQTATITPSPEPTLSPDITLSLRFINSDRIIETVGEVLRQNKSLRDYIQNNSGTYPQLAAILGPSLEGNTSMLTHTPTPTPTHTPFTPTHTPTPTPTPTHTPAIPTRVAHQKHFSYMVRVSDKDTQNPIQGAETSILIEQKIIDTRKTDVRGQVVFAVTFDLADEIVELLVMAKGYKAESFNIALRKDSPPEEVQLSALATPTPTNNTAIFTPTKTPSPSPTPKATSTPKPTYTTTPTITVIPTDSLPPTPPDPTGDLAIPVAFNFGTKVYLTGFDGVGINGPNEVSIGGAAGAEDARQPMFSRDGASLMVKATIDGVAGLFKLTASGFNPEIIIRRGSAEWPVLSPDGETVMFAEGTLDYRLHKRLPSPDIDTPEKNIEEISLNGFPIFAKNLLWSEDDRLVFQGCAVWRNAPGECGTWITYANNLDPQRIIVREAAQPMSIRGGTLAYMYRDPGKDWDIFIMSVDGGEAVDITNNDFEDGLPAISPDGNAVAYISNESGAWGVWTVSLDGQNKKFWFDINPGSGVFDIDKWSKDRMSWRR